MEHHQQRHRTDFVKRARTDTMIQTRFDLFERYLQAIGRNLPSKRRDDILAELRVNLESQLDDREEELGRPLTEGELTDWLKQLGSPLHVAMRYQPQQYLIGPAVFPMYWYVLRLALSWTGVIFIVVNGLLIATQASGAPSIGEAVSRLPGVLINVAAWITATFVALEFTASHYPQVRLALSAWSREWSPSALPPLEKAAVQAHKPKSYAQAVAEVVFGFLFLVWLTVIPHNPWLLMGPGAGILHASPFHLAPIWWDFYRVVVVVNFIQVGWNSYRLWDGAWQERSLALQLASKVFGLISVGMLIFAPHHAYLLLKHPDLDAMQYGATVDTINVWAWRGVCILGGIIVLQLIGESIKAIVDGYRGRLGMH
jgi:hypothetical protein